MPTFWLKQKKFGYKRYYPKPKTQADWKELYDSHKQLIPGIKQITVSWSKKGEGQTGARHFYSYNIPPLKHWNTNLAVVMEKNIEETVDPVIRLEMNDGSKKELNVKGMKNKDILQNILNLDPTSELITRGPGFRAPLYHE